MGCCGSSPAAVVTATTAFDANDYEAEALAKNTASVLDEVTALIAPRYKALHYIGSGHAGTTFACIDDRGRCFAAKIIVTEKEPQVQQTAKEVDLLSRLRNIPNTVCLFEVIQKGGRTALILEWCRGGELFHRMSEQAIQGRAIPEDAVRVIMRQLLRTVDSIHRLGYIHRNIQLENILLVSRHSEVSFRLAGFHLSCTREEAEASREICGAPGYIAPEMLSGNGGGGEPLDVWALGVLAYEALAGYLPFTTESGEFIDELKRTLSGEADFSRPPWGKTSGRVSADAEAFVRSFFVVDPAHRPTIPQLLESSWLQGSGQQAVSPLLAFDVPANKTGATIYEQQLAAPAWWGRPYNAMMAKAVTAAVTVPPAALPGHSLAVLEPLKGTTVTVVVPADLAPGMQFAASMPLCGSEVWLHTDAMTYPIVQEAVDNTAVVEQVALTMATPDWNLPMATPIVQDA